MNIYERNIKAMKTQSSLYNKMLYKIKDENMSNRLDYIELLSTKEEYDSLIISSNKKTYRLNSSYYPLKEAKIWAEQFEYTDMCNYVAMYGLGNGIFARELAVKLRDEDSMFIYEPSKEIFSFVLKHYDISDILLNEKVNIIVKEINDKEFQSIIKNKLDWTNVKYHILSVHPYYDEAFPNSLKKYLEDIKYAINSIVIKRNTLGMLGNDTTKNIINNYRYFEKAYNDMDLFNEFDKNIPAIIVSAGPSLNKNVEYLKDAKGKSIVIAVDRAYQLLIDNGIEPDFVITLDPRKPIEYLTKDKEFSTPMICTVFASEAILSAHKGKKIFYGVDEFTGTIFDGLNKKYLSMGIGGSVATGAFSVCVGLGFKNIILIGQDLAYSNSKDTHATGLIGDGDHLKEVFAVVEGINGKLVETRYDWYNYLTWFQDAIRSIKGITVIDATEGGAKIQGSIVMTLKEAIEKYCKIEVDTNSILKDKSYIINKGNRDKFISELENAIISLHEIINKTSKAIGYCNILIKEVMNNKANNNYSINTVKKIGDINKYINEQPIYALIDYDIGSDSVAILSDIYKLTGNEKQDQMITYQKAISMYNAIETSAKNIKQFIAKTLDYYKDLN